MHTLADKIAKNIAPNASALDYLKRGEESVFFD